MRRSVAVLLGALLAGLAATAPALADQAQSAVVSADPVDFTPHVLDGTVRAIAVVGDTVVVGGDFSRVTDSAGRTYLQRNNLFAYRLGTGQVLDFAPALDGPVYALATGPSGTVYAGGDFRQVNGAAQRGLTRFRLDTGAALAMPAIDWGDVRALAVAGPWLYAGGTFTRVGGVSRAGLARLSTATGAVDQGLDLHLAAPDFPRPRVEDLAVSPDGTRLVVIGVIEQALGQRRAQLLVADTAANPVRLADWYTPAYDNMCRWNFDTYLRGVAFSPDGSYFVVVTSGRLAGAQRMCDTAARFNMAGAGAHNPVWVNHTGGNSLLSVAVTGPAVYVGGHQQWVDNPYGDKSAGPGAVSRPGIAALDPVTGHALAWNPTRSRGEGTRALVACSAGLLIGSDTDRLGHEYHGRIGMFPLG